MKRVDGEPQGLVRANYMQQDTIRFPVILINPYNQSEQTLKPVDQEEGTAALGSFLRAQIPFSSIPPFYINEAFAYKQSQVIRVSGVDNGLHVSQSVIEALQQSEKILLLPQAHEIYGYRWIDIFVVGINNRVSVDQLLQSVRIRGKAYGDRSDFESASWHGPYRQAFLDYLAGSLEIPPSELHSFVVRKPPSGMIDLGKVKDDYLTLAWRVSSKIEAITIVPKFDVLQGGLWLECYAEKDKACERLLSTKRIVTDESEEKIRVIDWKGPGIQGIVDWIDGKVGVDRTTETKIILDPVCKYFSLHLDSDRLDMNINSKYLDKFKPIYLVPKEDGPYKWLDVQQDDVSRQRFTLFQFRVQLINGQAKLNGNWIGPQKQALADYLNGKIDASLLRSINVQIGTQGRVNICCYNGKYLFVILNERFHKAGEKVRVVPLEKEEGLVLEIHKIGAAQSLVARYRFERETLSLRKVRLPETSNLSALTPEEADQRLMDFFEEVQ